MKVIGIDFTSSSSKSKPIVALHCELEERRLLVRDLEKLSSLPEFDELLTRGGPWIAGIDFPFGQSRRFVENCGWPLTWHGVVDQISKIDRRSFRLHLDTYRSSRSVGDKEHRRRTDQQARSISPQKLYGVPVALMFYEGAPRLVRSGVTIPRMQIGDPKRIVIEAYPGILARTLHGKRCSYKSDDKKKQNASMLAARQNLLDEIKNEAPQSYGLKVIDAPNSLVDDPTGDEIDALLCAMQAGWCWTQRDAGFGSPNDLDELEGWIGHPFPKE
jgi:hypothetical protein